MKDKILLVPESDIREMEKVRANLYNLLQDQANDIAFLSKLTEITGSLWVVGNKKYPEYISNEEPAPELFPNTLSALDKLTIRK